VGSIEKSQDRNIGKVFAINFSRKKGTAKTSIERVNLIEDFGLEGDAHAGSGKRQVSLLAIESIRKQAECPKAKSESLSLGPGDFAENITTEGVDLAQLNIGDSLRIGKQVVLEISKIGKECHKYCAIYQKVGDCIMPREGIFAKVSRGGGLVIGDEIVVDKNAK
jgi:MOSC domain-containing protein YiiM